MRWLQLVLLCGMAASLAGAGTWQEDFATAPESRGWRVAGDASLFRWNATNRNLEVTWDSSRSNTYFHRSLETVLTRADDFSFAFDLQLNDAQVGTTPGRPFTFEVALGLIRLSSAMSPDLQRGTGINAAHGPRNLAEFDYFPDSGYGATISPGFVSSNNQPAFVFAYPLELDAGALFHVTMTYTASNQTMQTTVTRNEAPFGPIGSAILRTDFTDFRLDHFAVSSYNDAGADGSILAHGTVDNIRVTVPSQAIATLALARANGVWSATFAGLTGFLYALERSTNLTSWEGVAGPVGGAGGILTLQDTTPGGAAFYRVKADRP